MAWIVALSGFDCGLCLVGGLEGNLVGGFDGGFDGARIYSRSNYLGVPVNKIGKLIFAPPPFAG